MKFKKSYKFRDALPFAILLGFLLVGDIATLICIIAMRNSEKFSGVIAGIIFCVISAVGLLVLIIILVSLHVTINEEKIVQKVLMRTVLSYNINDIYKIEKKPGPKGVPVFIIHGSTPQNNSRKSKIETINFIADKKREEILRHFITNPEVWYTEL